MKSLLLAVLTVGALVACQPQERAPAPPPGAPGPQGEPGKPGRVDTVVVEAPEYFVQVAAVHSGAELDGLLAQLRQYGYTGHIARDRDDYYRVTVGPYGDRRDAQRVRFELRRQLGLDAFIVNPK